MVVTGAAVVVVAGAEVVVAAAVVVVAAAVVVVVASAVVVVVTSSVVVVVASGIMILPSVKVTSSLLPSWSITLHRSLLNVIGYSSPGFASAGTVNRKVVSVAPSFATRFLPSPAFQT